MEAKQRKFWWCCYCGDGPHGMGNIPACNCEHIQCNGCDIIFIPRKTNTKITSTLRDPTPSGQGSSISRLVNSQSKPNLTLADVTYASLSKQPREPPEQIGDASLKKPYIDHEGKAQHAEDGFVHHKNNNDISSEARDNHGSMQQAAMDLLSDSVTHTPKSDSSENQLRAGKGVASKLRQYLDLLILCVSTTYVTITGRKELPYRHYQVRWTCRCGHIGWDYFETIDLEDLNSYVRNMAQEGYIRNANIFEETTGHIAKLVDLGTNGLRALRRSISKWVGWSWLSHRAQEDLAYHMMCLTQERCLYLHICLQKSPLVAKLGYLHMCLIKEYTDKQFFQDLRAGYKSQRTKRTSLTGKLKRIEFVKFEARPFNLVDQIQPGQFPAPDNDDYEIMPLRIGANFLLHIFVNQEAELLDEPFLVDGFPKKKKAPLKFDQNANHEANIGYGIHFVEGWDIEWIALILCGLALLGSLVFGICYGLLQHDLQDAWTVSAYITSVCALVLMTFQLWRVYLQY